VARFAVEVVTHLNSGIVVDAETEEEAARVAVLIAKARAVRGYGYPVTDIAMAEAVNVVEQVSVQADLA
jgi:hypothetical protein